MPRQFRELNAERLFSLNILGLCYKDGTREFKSFYLSLPDHADTPFIVRSTEMRSKMEVDPDEGTRVIVGTTLVFLSRAPVAGQHGGNGGNGQANNVPLLNPYEMEEDLPAGYPVDVLGDTSDEEEDNDENSDEGEYEDEEEEEEEDYDESSEEEDSDFD